MTRVFSGIQPTGAKHIGNYLGALRPWVDGQYKADCIYSIVDLHALTIPKDPAEVRIATIDTAALILAVGVDPEVAVLFAQSHVPEHAQLSWLLECTASFGELGRMTAWKDKTAKGGESSARSGLFTYPVLQAADILLYDTDEVPVGDDQRQHVELSRDIAQRFNHRYGDTFVVPEARVPPPRLGARIMDLQEPTNKMSTSAASDAGVIRLTDDPKTIERKLKRAVTDTETGTGSVRHAPDTKPGVATLIELLGTSTGRSVREIEDSYTRYGDLKKDTAAAVVEMLSPIQARYRGYLDDPGQISLILAAGADKARETASVTYARAADAMGLVPPAKR